MNIKWYIYSSILCCLVSHNLKPEDNQSSCYEHEFKTVLVENSLEKYLAPVAFSGLGIQQFVEQIFNRQVYGQEVLPNDFRHLLQFLHHGKQTASKAYSKSVLKLFSNKIKSATYVNAYGLGHLLKHLPSVMDTYVTPTPILAFDGLKKQINEILYGSFLSQYDIFKKDPDSFFGTVSDSLIAQLKKSCQEENGISKKQVQQSTYRFLDICLNKLIWNPQEHASIWPNIKEVSTALEKLVDLEILADADDLDDLYWTLIHRFCFFMDVTQPDLPICFYETIKDDINSNEILLCDLEEQEEHLTTKGEHLMQALVAGEAKARMRMQA